MFCPSLLKTAWRCAGLATLAALLATTAKALGQPVPVTLQNFIRAETDFYFGKLVKENGLGWLRHRREVAPIDQQDVVRMNRDTIYSSGVFDLASASLSITLPDPGRRFMSMQVISEDHFTMEVVYTPGRNRYTQDLVGTRYVAIIIRILADPRGSADLQVAHTLQDAIKTEQVNVGTWEAPDWDPVSQKRVRDALAELRRTAGDYPGNAFGTREEVDPLLHLMATAVGWGGNPTYAALYAGVYPEQNDGKVSYMLKVQNVPVDGFWSISVYNRDGFFEKNDLDAYSLNNLTAKPDADGSFTIRFGGDPEAAPNHLPIMPGWNYTVRLYRPRKEVLNGSWKFPEAQPVQ